MLDPKRKSQEPSFWEWKIRKNTTWKWLQEHPRVRYGLEVIVDVNVVNAGCKIG